MFGQWGSKPTVAPDISALAKVMDKTGANFSQAVAQSAVGLALEILGPAAILARDLDHLPGAQTDSSKVYRHRGGTFNDLLSAEEATALIGDLAKSEYCSYPLKTMTVEQCASIYQTTVVELAKKLVKASLKQESQFLTDDALDAVAQAVIQRNITETASKSYGAPIGKPNDLFRLKREMEQSKKVTEQDYEKISTVWGRTGLQASWALVAAESNASFTGDMHKLATRNRDAADHNFAQSMQEAQAALKLLHKGEGNGQQVINARQPIISAATLPVNINFKPIKDALPEDFGLKELNVYNAAIEFAQPNFNLGERMMSATKAGFTFKK